MRLTDILRSYFESMHELWQLCVAEWGLLSGTTLFLMIAPAVTIYALYKLDRIVDERLLEMKG